MRRISHRGMEDTRSFSGLLSAGESAYSKPHLHGVDPRIRRRQSGVRDVHVAEFETYIVLRAEDVQAQRGLIHEIHSVRSCRNVMVGENRAPSEFEVGRDGPMTFEVPLESKRVEAHT